MSEPTHDTKHFADRAKHLSDETIVKFVKNANEFQLAFLESMYTGTKLGDSAKKEYEKRRSDNFWIQELYQPD